MIRLMNGWEIDYDGDYIVRKNSGKKGKDGQPIYLYRKYPNSLSAACKIVMQAELGEYIANNEITLEDAIIKMQKINAEMESVLVVLKC